MSDPDKTAREAPGIIIMEQPDKLKSIRSRMEKINSVPELNALILELLDVVRVMAEYGRPK